MIEHYLKTAPALEPVTLAEMRAHLGISQSADTARDTIITGRISSARSWAEDYCRRAFITQTWQAFGTFFPYPEYWSKRNRGQINCRGKLQSVTSIKYIDQDGVQQTLDSVLYQVDLNKAQILPAYDQAWPIARYQPNAIEIEYICGYGSAASAVPEPIKDALKFIVAQWEVFQGTIEGGTRPMTIPYAATQLLNNYIDHREAFG